MELLSDVGAETCYCLLDENGVFLDDNFFGTGFFHEERTDKVVGDA